MNPTGGVACLLAVAIQDDSWRGGQTLQSGRGQNLLRVERWKLSNTLLKVRLRQDPAHGERRGHIDSPRPPQQAGSLEGQTIKGLDAHSSVLSGLSLVCGFPSTLVLSK